MGLKLIMPYVNQIKGFKNAVINNRFEGLHDFEFEWKSCLYRI